MSSLIESKQINIAVNELLEGLLVKTNYCFISDLRRNVSKRHKCLYFLENRVDQYPLEVWCTLLQYLWDINFQFTSSEDVKITLAKLYH